MASVASLPTHEDQLQDPEYRNWDKACLGLYYLKEGLQSYLDNAIRSLQNTFLSQICKHEGIEEANCSSCTTANVLTCPTYGVCNLRKRGRCSYHEKGNSLTEHKSCPNKVCQSMCAKITSMHHFQPSWRNTDARKWCTTHWEIAKCFLPATGYETKSSAAEMDCSGLLNIAINCVSIRNDFQMNMDIFSEIIKVRNDVVHSATSKITNTELEGYIDMMIKLLENGALKTYTEVIAAIGKLKQLKDCKFIISTKDEEDIRNEAVQEAEQKKRDDYLGRKNELQTGLCSIYEDHFKTVPISPPLDELTENVDDVFVKLVIREDLIHDPNKTQQTGKGKKVENLIDIFSNHRNDKICKNMYVVGNAGMGKTTWCMKLLSTWVSAQTKLRDPNKGTDILTKDETMMLEFDVVLFVSLRHALFKNNIKDMIKDQLFSNRPNLDQLTSEVLEREPEKCLVIIDGLDEWNHPENPEIISPLQHPGLPNRKNLYDCPCLTTTRPWKLEELRLPADEIDLAVTIEGLDDKKLLAERVIHIRQKGVADDVAKERTIEKFTTCLKALSFKPCAAVWKEFNFISIPLILVFIVSLWFEEGNLESTWAGTFCGLIECLILKAEGEKRRGRKGRLQQVDGIENLRAEWGKTYMFLPETIHGKHLTKYSTLLLKLGKLAFNTLIAPETTETLVFSDQTLKNLFSEKELEVAVKIGILTQSKVVGKTIKPMSSLSFLHKTIHEYFAALYMCSVVQERYNNLQKFRAFCCDQLCINKMENVILFVYGIDATTANILSQHNAYIQLKQGSLLDVNLAHQCCKELEDYQRVKESNSYIACIYGAIIENGNILKLTNLHWAYLQTLTLHFNDDDNYHNLIASPDQLQAVNDTLKWSQLQETDNKSKTYRCLKTAVSRTNIQEIDFSQVVHLHEVSLKNIEYCKVLLNSKELRVMSFNRTKQCTFIIQHNGISLDHDHSSTDYTDRAGIICDNLEECTLQIFSLSKTTDLKLRNCNSCTIELQTPQIVDSILTDIGSDISTSSCTLSTNLNINKVDIDRCKSCEFKIEEENQYQTTEIINYHEQFKNKQRCCNKQWLINRIKFLECESCKLSVAVPDRPVTVLDKEKCIACKSLKSNNKTTRINTVYFQKSKSCELNIYSVIQNIKFVNFDKARNEIPYKSSDDCIIRNLELSNSSLCELKLRNIETRKEQNDLMLYDPSLVVDFIQIYEVYCTDAGVKKQLSLSVRNGQSNTRNQIQVEMLSVSRTMPNKSGNILNALKPIEHLKEFTIGSVSKHVPLTQIFESMTSLEKLYLNASIQSEMTFSTEPEILQNKCIEPYMLQSISSIFNLKCLDLSGLSVDMYKLAANVLPTMKIEELVISNSNIEIPECFIRYIQSLKSLKCLSFNGKHIENVSKLVTTFSIMAQLETLIILSTEKEILNIYKFSNGHLILFKNNIVWGKTKEHSEKLAKCHRGLADIKKYNLSLKHTDITTSAISALQYLVNLEHLTLEISGDALLEFKAFAESNTCMKKLHTFEMFARDKDIPEYVNKYISYFNNLKHLTVVGRSITQLDNLAMIVNLSMPQLETLNLSTRDTDISKYLTHSLEKLAFLKHLTLKGRQIANIEDLTISLYSMSKLESLCLSANRSDTSYFAVQEKSIQNVEVTVQSVNSEHKLKKLKLAIRDTDIPGSVIESIRNHVNLEHLTLKGKQIQNVECLANFLLDMTQLETLGLSSRDTDIPGSVVKSIGNLHNLKHLTLEGRRIQSIDSLVSILLELKQLVTLDVLAPFRMTQLETLKLSSRDCDIPGSVVESMHMLRHLKHLTLEGRKIQSDNYLHFWLPLQLETLKLISRDNCFISRQFKTRHLISRDTDMPEFIYNLKHLTLEGRQIQNIESLVDILPEWKQLETLRLLSRDTDIPEFIVESIRMLYNLKHLTLEGRQMQNIESLVDILPEFTQLETLRLLARDTDIPRPLVTCIEHKTRLKILKYDGRSLECARVSN